METIAWKKGKAYKQYNINGRNSKKVINRYVILNGETNMSDLKFSLKSVSKKPSRRYRKGSKYDPVIDAFLESYDSLVEVGVEGRDANYLRTQLNKRIDARDIKANIKTSVVNNVLYLEKVK